MPPIAPPATIRGSSLWQPVDASGVSFDYAKLQTAPASLFEDGEEYRELLGEHGWEVQRSYKCNWSDLAAAMQYFYGYSIGDFQKYLNDQCPTWNGLLPDGSLFQGTANGKSFGGKVGTISRVIPAQDPYRPYLYADHVEVLGGLGVATQDPNLFLGNIDGQPIGVDGKPLQPGAPPVAPSDFPSVGVGPAPSGSKTGVYHWEGLVALFDDPRLGDNAAKLTAAIYWSGDDPNQISNGTAEYLGQPGQFAVSGAHDYTTPGPWTVTAKLTTQNGYTATVQGVIDASKERVIGGAHNFPDAQGRARLPGLVYAENRGASPVSASGALSGDWADGVAKLRVTYRSRPYVVRNDVQNAAWGQGELGRYVERVPRYAIQAIPLANIAKTGQQLLFAATTPFAGIPVPEPGILLVPTASWIYRWHDVPFYPAGVFRNLVGRVNLTGFDGILGFPLFPAQTLLCQAPEIRFRRNACGQPTFDISFILDYRESGWNQFVASDGFYHFATWGGGQPADDGSNLVFGLAEFADLFANDQQFPFL